MYSYHPKKCIITILIIECIISILILAWRFSPVPKRNKLSIHKENKNYIHANTLLDYTHNQSRFDIERKDVPKVLLVSPFSIEVDILLLKLDLLHSYIDGLWILEWTYTQRGLSKPLFYDRVKTSEQLKKYEHIVHHIVDTTVPPSQGKELGWWGEEHPRLVLGQYIIDVFPTLYDINNTIIIFSDFDEIPSVQAIEWLKQKCCQYHETYEFASRMPLYIYNFHWKAKDSGYGLATARSLIDEIDY